MFESCLLCADFTPWNGIFRTKHTTMAFTGKDLDEQL